MEDVATFEDLAIDDTLDTVERVRKYATSTIALQRLVHVKMLTEAAEAAGYEETCTTLIPILKTLALDIEWVVRQHLGEQLGGVSEYCIKHGGEPGYRLILETMLPLLSKLLGDRQEEVRLSTGISLCRISKLMRLEDRGKHVLTIILQLAHDDEQEELRMTAAKLLNDVVESLGTDLCHQFVSPELVSLAEDPVFRVRKAAALNMQSVCMVGGDQDTTDRLLPAYIRLTKDDIYRVRKACAESLVDISKSVNADLRSHVLVEVFLRLSTDNSKFVRHSALQQLGPFIATLKGEEVTADLLKLFTSMASPSSGDAAVDNEIRLYCAFSLPGVAITVGPQRWDELKEAFQILVRDVQWNIRRTLAFSIHELARVLQDPVRVEAELLFAFDLFLRDVDDVRAGVLQSVAVFLAHLTPSTRESYLQSLCEMVSRTTPTNWRPREILSSQLPDLMGLFTEDSAQNILSPLCFALVEDTVNVVREKTIHAFAPLIERFTDEHADWRAAIIARLIAMAQSDTYVRRQLFLHIGGSVARGKMDHALFQAEIMPHLLALAKDPVPNIRIAMAIDIIDYPAWLLRLPAGREALISLLIDSNKDVKEFMARFRDKRPDMVEMVAADLPLPTPPPALPREPTVDGPPAPLQEDEEEGEEVVVEEKKKVVLVKADVVVVSSLPPPPPPSTKLAMTGTDSNIASDGEQRDEQGDSVHASSSTSSNSASGELQGPQSPGSQDEEDDAALRAGLSSSSPTTHLPPPPPPRLSRDDVAMEVVAGDARQDT